MPGYAYGIPAVECRIGSILRAKPGSVCHKCYALKGMYVFPVVRKAQYNRLQILNKSMVLWEARMISLLRAKYARKIGDDRVFRWHDSGDLQSPKHLASIVRIAKALPDIRFWLPTRERAMVTDYLAAEPKGFPANLVVRISAAMVGQATGPLPKGTVGSTVGAGIGYSCPAKGQGNECLDCRACWKKSTKNVDYSLH